MSGKTQNRAARSGFTLIEVAIAAVVLAALAIGAGALYHQSWGQMSIQRNKRAALVAATTHLESLRATNYGKLTGLLDDVYSPQSLTCSDSYVWTRGTDDTVSINGQSQPITTTVEYKDADPGNAATTVDCLSVRVAVAYRLATPEDRVVLETLIAP